MMQAACSKPRCGLQGGVATILNEASRGRKRGMGGDGAWRVESAIPALLDASSEAGRNPPESWPIGRRGED